ncbi:hypothetical protein JYK14_00835 [Siccirubricoccus sp. KC 17139]|uniref:Uncharacterized protein n=1 Tax=Siccirubricoccus soli TaxID=2899147 RepID=A0ABT1CYJ2_9PROT|nr:hypothetical protein [Siccirubricoccus soli]MCO6414726.1 hypothetical protein [Siccirubricoccus soli]MCP2680856.1 hypothetical protein [Siccirubricoccus soli]
MRSRVVLAAGLTAALAGCGSAPSGAPLACPTPGILAEGADLTRYRPGPVRDLTTLEFDARLTGLSGGCNPGRGNRSIEMKIVASFTVERGAGAEGRVFELPWSVVMIDPATDRIIGQDFVEQVGFGRNETRTSFQSAPVTVTLPLGEGRRAQDYRIWATFALTPEDLALNRRRGPR